MRLTVLAGVIRKLEIQKAPAIVKKAGAF